MMSIDELLKKAREIWGGQKLTLEEIIVRQGVAIGDIHRYARDKSEGKEVDEAELKKELGNIIFSTIRWCDDLGYSPEECIELAQEAQIAYRKR
ncbi:MAG TPA: hypothetical protein VHA05_00255 [Candidatus Saccharimonadales bacterium]|nr:hypothetical protein [Candidatus Saccharimonadales bacterium]